MTTPSDHESTHRGGPQSATEVVEDAPEAGTTELDRMRSTTPMPVVERARSLDELAAAVMARPVDPPTGPRSRTSRAMPYVPPAPLAAVPPPPVAPDPPAATPPTPVTPPVAAVPSEPEVAPAEAVEVAEPSAEAPVSPAPVSSAPVSSPPVSPAADAAEPVDVTSEPVALMQVSDPPVTVVPVVAAAEDAEPTESIQVLEPPADEADSEPTGERRNEQTAKLAYASLAAPVHYGRPRWEEPTEPMEPPEPRYPASTEEPEKAGSGSRRDRRNQAKADKNRSRVKDRTRTGGRRPLFGLVALVVLTLGGAFFGWVSADPLWLSVGDGSQGTVTVTDCVSRGAGETCIGNFKSSSFSARDVTISGLPPALQKGNQPARMLSAEHTWAYAGSVRGLQMRWGIGLILALVLGVLAAMATGAKYLRPFGRGKVFGARVLAFAGPVVAFFALILVALI